MEESESFPSAQEDSSTEGDHPAIGGCLEESVKDARFPRECLARRTVRNNSSISIGTCSSVSMASKSRDARDQAGLSRAVGQ
jgi:hypothetical protein